MHYETTFRGILLPPPPPPPPLIFPPLSLPIKLLTFLSLIIYSI